MVCVQTFSGILLFLRRGTEKKNNYRQCYGVSSYRDWRALGRPAFGRSSRQSYQKQDFLVAEKLGLGKARAVPTMTKQTPSSGVKDHSRITARATRAGVRTYHQVSYPLLLRPWLTKRRTMPSRNSRPGDMQPSLGFCSEQTNDILCLIRLVPVDCQWRSAALTRIQKQTPFKMSLVVVRKRWARTKQCVESSPHLTCRSFLLTDVY